MAKKLWSIFTDDLSTCYFTGSNDVEVHHIFESRMGFKKKSEEYGFVCPLDKHIHPNGAFCTTEEWIEIDWYLKKECQKYFLEHYGTRDEWYDIFGRYYDEEF